MQIIYIPYKTKKKLKESWLLYPNEDGHCFQYFQYRKQVFKWGMFLDLLDSNL